MATYTETSIIKVTFGGLTGSFPQNVSVPGLKAGDVVLSVVSSGGSIISGGASNTVEGIVTVDDQLRVTGGLNDVNPYTVILSRIS